jgi:cell division septal protein FtsQ
VAGRKGSRENARPRARAASAASIPRDHVALSRFAPSGRSVATGLLILVAALGAYGLARGTSAFAVEAVAVHGAPKGVGPQVDKVLAHVDGRSLLSLDLPALEAAVEDVPAVASVTFDRGFPHTLNVHVVPEIPVAVARQGTAAWLVAASGRLIAALDRGARRGLPRIWLKRSVELTAGASLTGAPLRAARAVAPIAGAKLLRVASVRSGDSELTLVLRSGTEVRLGDGSERLLKLTIARQILPSLAGSQGYVDVSVPARPVASSTLDPQVDIETQTSTNP